MNSETIQFAIAKGLTNMAFFNVIQSKFLPSYMYDAETKEKVERSDAYGVLLAEGKVYPAYTWDEISEISQFYRNGESLFDDIRYLKRCDEEDSEDMEEINSVIDTYVDMGDETEYLMSGNNGKKIMEAIEQGNKIANELLKGK